MFTGLIQNRGQVKSFEKLSGSHAKLSIESEVHFEDWKLGESIAVNGCCLTLVAEKNGLLDFDLSEETLERSNLRSLQMGESVHLERALKMSDRLGGHFVQGHVDGVGEVMEIQKNSDFWQIAVKADKALISQMVEKGSVAVNGVSLTINQVSDQNSSFQLLLIPETLRQTSFKNLEAGTKVNLEIDMISKLVKRAVEGLRLSC